MSALPLGATRYFRSSVFSAVPLGQKRDHSLRSDVWSRIRVLDGELTFVAARDGESKASLRAERRASTVVHAGESVDVEPGVLHHLEPSGDEVKFVVHLYRVSPDTTRNEVSRWENEGGRVQH